MNYVILLVLIAVGLYDLWFVYTNQATLSQRYQKLLPKWVDMILFAVGLMVLTFVVVEIDERLRIIMAGFLGHCLFPNKETYKR